MDAMSRSPVETPKGDESWRLREARRKRSCRSSGQGIAKDTEDLEKATKAGIGAAASWALEDSPAASWALEDSAAAGCGCKGSSGCGRCNPAGELPNGSVHAATTKPNHMVTYRVMDELASDGTSVYRSAKVQKFLARFGVRNKPDPETTLSSSEVVFGRRTPCPTCKTQDPWQQQDPGGHRGSSRGCRPCAAGRRTARGPSSAP